MVAIVLVAAGFFGRFYLGAPALGSHETSCSTSYINPSYHFHEGGSVNNHCTGGHDNDASIYEQFDVDGGFDKVDANIGNDEIHLGSGTDSATGGTYRDFFFGGNGDESMHGGKGDDYFQDNQADQIDHDGICGGDGDDSGNTHGSSNKTDIQDGDESDAFFGEAGAGDLPILKDAGDLAYEDGRELAC